MRKSFQIAYDMLKGAHAENADQELTEGVNRHIADGLGYKVYPPTNFPYWSIASHRSADPYRDPQHFRKLPDYVNDFDSGRAVAPAVLRLSLRQEDQGWTAVYLTTDHEEVSKEAAATPARATVLAALATWLLRQK